MNRNRLYSDIEKEERAARKRIYDSFVMLFLLIITALLILWAPTNKKVDSFIQTEVSKFKSV